MLGLIGYQGRWAQNYLKILDELGIEWLGRDLKDGAAVYAGNRGADDFYSKVDKVIICSPTDTHYKEARECIKRGINVLVEKPTTLTSKDTKKLIALAEKKKVGFMTGYVYRFNSLIQNKEKIIDLMNEKEIEYILFSYTQYTFGREDSYQLYNLGSHLFSIFLEIFEGELEFLYSSYKPNSSLILARLDDIPVCFEMSCNHPDKDRSMIAILDDGYLKLDFLNNAYEYNKKRAVIHGEDPLKAQLRFFLDTVCETRQVFKAEEDVKIGEYLEKCQELALKPV